MNHFDCDFSATLFVRSHWDTFVYISFSSFFFYSLHIGRNGYSSFELILTKLRIMTTMKAETDTRDTKRKRKKKRFCWVVGCILCLVVKTFSMSLSLSHSHQCFPLSVKLLLLCHIILVWMIPSVFFSLPSPSLCLFSLLFFLCVCVWVSIFGCISFGVHMHEITAIALTWLCERCMRMVWKLNSN